MKGSIQFHRSANYYYVAWPDKGKVHCISRYKGLMCRDGAITGLSGKQMAERLLALMQADYENGTLNIDRWKGKIQSDVVPYLKQWLQEISKTVTPATAKDYRNSIKNHLAPWFDRNRVQLHEIQYDVLCRLLSDIKRTGKGKRNVLYCLRGCLDYAFKSNRIAVMPAFPEAKKYNVIEPKIKWLPEARQIKVIEAIPVEHQPIFWSA